MAELRVQPEAARLRVSKALTETEGNAVQAAALLGVSRRTMLRLLKDPGIAAIAHRIRAKAKGERDGRTREASPTTSH